MSESEVTRVIPAPPEVLFPFLVDLSNVPTWRSGEKDAVLVAGSAATVGATYAVTTHAPEIGVDIALMLKLVEVVPHERIVIEMTSEIARFVLTYRLAPVEGGTSLTAHVTVDAPGPIARMAAKQNGPKFAEDLDRLAAHFERT